MDSITLKKLQNIEFEILSDIHNYCKNYNINYSLYGGTLIGAVRHQGFIPWDDDIDIVMTRTDYTKFCETWMCQPLEGYYLENIEVDKFTQNTHAKIRRDGTVLLSDVEDETVGHHGIWIDIFVMDKVSHDPKIEKSVIGAGRQMILIAKANGKLPKENLKKKIARNILKIIYPAGQRKRKLKRITDFLRQNDNIITDHFDRCDMCMLDFLKIRFPQNTGDEFETLTFEGKDFQVFSNYDTVLRIMYGDYMELPPKEDQVCKHNPKKIVF